MKVGLTILLILLVSAFWFFNQKEEEANCSDCNLILITVDTLRADHLGFYGYARATSPFLDQFSKESIVFNNHITPRPKTGPSIASLFTGLYPNKLQIRNNREPLNNKIQTLTSIFKKNNFKTAAVISNIALKHEYSGLKRDFDTFDLHVDEEELNRKDHLQRNAKNTFKASLKILKDFKNKQFFLWIHLMDPHGPYYPPEEYRNYFHSNSKNLVQNSLLPEYQLLPSAEVVDGLTDINHYIDNYDDEIRYLDIQFASFFKELTAMGLLSNSMIVFSADHGESLSEHEYYLEHGAELYENNIRIPLAIRLPGKLTKPVEQYSGLTSSIDILPSMVNFFKLTDVQETGGFNLFELIKDTTLKREFTISESYQDNVFNRLAARNQNSKVINFRDGKRCFDLLKDPTETAPVSCEQAPFPFLSSKLEEYQRDNQKYSRDQVKPSAMDPKDVQTLKSLGYF